MNIANTAITVLVMICQFISNSLIFPGVHYYFPCGWSPCTISNEVTVQTEETNGANYIHMALVINTQYLLTYDHTFFINSQEVLMNRPILCCWPTVNLLLKSIFICKKHLNFKHLSLDLRVQQQNNFNLLKLMLFFNNEQ